MTAAQGEKAPNAQMFGQYAAAYALHRPRYPDALWAWMASQCAQRQQAWDAGCGNGQAALALAAHFDAVLATDVSAEQIAAALPHPRVRYRVARSEDVALPLRSVDLVCVAQALHWFDLPRFWPRVQAALRPGGVFVALAYGYFSIDGVADEITQRLFYDRVAPYQAEGNRQVAAGYAGIVLPFERVDAPVFAVTCNWSLDQLLGYAGTWSAVARMRSEAGVDPLADYRAALEPSWGDAQTPRTVHMPLTVKAGRHT